MQINNLKPYTMPTINPEIIYILLGMIFIFILLLFGKQIVKRIKTLFDYYFVEEKELISGKVIEITEDDEDFSPIFFEDSNLTLPMPPPEILPPIRKISVEKEDGEIVLIRMREDKIKELHLMINNSIEIKCCKSKSEDVYSYDYASR